MFETLPSCLAGPLYTMLSLAGLSVVVWVVTVNPVYRVLNIPKFSDYMSSLCPTPLSPYRFTEFVVWLKLNMQNVKGRMQWTYALVGCCVLDVCVLLLDPPMFETLLSCLAGPL